MHACRSKKIYFLPLWLSKVCNIPMLFLYMNHHNVKLGKKPTVYFWLRTTYSVIYTSYRNCILISFHIAHQRTGTALLHKSFHGNVNFSEGLAYIPCLAKPQPINRSDGYEGHPHKSFLTLFSWCILGGSYGWGGRRGQPVC